MFNNQDFHIMETGQSRSFMQRVFGWMAIALGISAATAYFVAASPVAVNMLYSNSVLIMLLVVAQLGLVVYLNARLGTMSTGSAIGAFLAYSALSGATLSAILLIYTAASVGATLLVAAGMFAAMALYGTFTRSDLSSLGDFLFMGVIGLFIANIVGIFVHSANFSLVTAAFGVMIFTLFTAYDVQQIKRFGNHAMLSNNDMIKASLMGALKLYLDFVNLFIYLLRFFGQRRD